MSRFPQQPQRGQPKAAQQPSNPPVTLATPDIQGVRESLQTAQQILAAAYQEVQQQAQTLIQQCRQTNNDTVGCIKSAINTALQSAYTTQGLAQQDIRNNLAYLMSAAQQYASLLGYEPLNFDLSKIPSNVPRTMDIADPGSPGGVDVNAGISPGQYNVLPRFVGVPDNLQAAEPLTYNIRPDNPDQNASPYGYTVSGQATPQPASLSTGSAGSGQLLPTAPVVSLPPPIINPAAGVATPAVAGTGTPPATISPVGTVVGLSAGNLPVQSPSGINVGTGQKGIASTQAIARLAPGQLSTIIPPATPGQIAPVQPGGLIPPTNPSSSGCPTSLSGLPSREDVYFGNIAPRNGMWIACGSMVAQITTDQGKANAGEVCGAWTDANGVSYYAVVDPTCPINGGQQNVPPINPAPPNPPNVGQPEKCPPSGTPAAQQTPWQIANCPQPLSTGTICPAPTIACPAPVISVNLQELCACITNALQASLPVPVDLDQIDAFMFSPDDVEWKKNALLWNGKWLQDLNASDSGADYDQELFKDVATATESFD